MPLPLLLVEDDAVLADGLVRTLQAQDMQVELLHDGLAADARLQQPQAAQLAVIVLDIGLPGIDGFEVLRRLRARGAQTPVLLLTARDAVEDRVRGLEAGADDYLV
jgi:DNA-binding response OmpR family regulator